MKRRGRWIVIAGVVMFATAFYLILRGNAPVTYEGKLIPDLALQLVSPHPTEREQAARGFAVLGTNAVPELVRMLHATDSKWRSYVWRNWFLVPDSIRRPILGRMRPPGSARSRQAAGQALELLGRDAFPAIPALSNCLNDQSSPEVQHQAAATLAAIGRSALPAVVPLLQSTNAAQREFAYRILARMGPDAAPALPDLVQALEAAALPEQLRILEALRPIVEAEALRLRQATRSAMPQSGAAQDLRDLESRLSPINETLCQLAANPDPDIAGASLELLRSLAADDEKTVAVYAAALRNPVESVKLTALRGLAAARGKAKPAASAVRACLDDSSPEVRAWAELVLGRSEQ